MSFEQPWVEKYRPSSLVDIVGNKDTIERLKVIVSTSNIAVPHLLLCGSPGTGKTSSVLCLAKELLEFNTQISKNLFKEAVMECNASDDRGLDVVRHKIKTFAQKKVSFPTDSKHKFKIIILDEADSMTSSSQQALRRIMEIYSNTTKFFICCNNSSKIIEPIQSRCAVIRYQSIQYNDMYTKLQYISNIETIPLSKEAIEALIYVSDGDLRYSINSFQATASAHRYNIRDKHDREDINKYVTAEDVFKVCDQPNPVILNEIIKICIESCNLPRSILLLKRIINRGFSCIDIARSLFKCAQNIQLYELTNLNQQPEELQMNVLKIISQCAIKLHTGSPNSTIQLYSLIAQLSMITSE